MKSYGINNYINVDRHRIKINADTVSQQSITEEYASILSRFNSELNIMYSGGIDSEIVAEVCDKHDIPHSLHFIALVHDNKIFNAVDYKNAMSYSNDIEVHYLEFDQFFNSGEFIDVALKYQTRSPQLACHLKVAEDIGKNIVFGGDSMFFHYDFDSNVASFKSTETGHFCYNNLVKHTGGIGNMANASYSLLIKYLRIQCDLALSGNVYKVWTDPNTNMQKYNYRWKCDMYRKAGFTSLPKENKMTGFEAVKQYYSDKYNEVGTCRKFDEMYRKPLHKIVDLPGVGHLLTSPTPEIKQLYRKFGENYDKSRF